MESKTEFKGRRAKMYEVAIAKYPEARREDIDAMYRLLDPKRGERILDLGGGNGYFSKDIANKLEKSGYLLVVDPSEDQLKNLLLRVKLPQIDVKTFNELKIPKSFFDKIWSFGAFHHAPDQTNVMKEIYRGLKEGGLAVICDVFQGSKLARHFDDQVARYCETGHEVKFLSDEFAKTLCYLSGFQEDKVKIIDLPQKWKFNSKRDLGEFIYNLHAMTKLKGNKEEKIEKTFEGCERILGVDYSNGKYELNWPMKALIARK